MITNRPILITGIPRSGASVIAKIINLCGTYAGKVDRMHENIHIKCQEAKFLKDIGADIDGQWPLPETNELCIPVNWAERVLPPDLNSQPHKTWMYKSSLIALLWPVWNYAFPDAKWVIVRRRTGDIIQSCLKTDFMDAFSDKEGWLQMVHAYEERFVAMINEGVNCKIVWPERMAHGDYQQMHDTLEWLGLRWDNSSIFKAADPLLKYSRKKEKEEA